MRSLQIHVYTPYCMTPPAYIGQGSFWVWAQPMRRGITM